MSQKYEERVNHIESSTRFIKQQISDTAPTMDSDDDSAEKKNLFKLKPAFFTSAVAGGLAGIIVDCTLYPLDTFKTRLQSKEGFRASGGFKGIYKGIIPVLMFSAPISALFFATYNTIINAIRTKDKALNPFTVIVAASVAEIFCSTVRVPMEIVKQRRQTSNARNFQIMMGILRHEGLGGFYRGFWSTFLREIPFSAIQYPLWEYMLEKVVLHNKSHEVSALDTALCGAAAGAVAAVCTTPMDVVKTRMMLAEKRKIDVYKKNLNINIAKEVYRDRGLRGFFSGVIPRVLWITLGGFIYFGAYDKAKTICEKNKEWFLVQANVVPRKKSKHVIFVEQEKEEEKEEEKEGEKEEGKEDEFEEEEEEREEEKNALVEKKVGDFTEGVEEDEFLTDEESEDNIEAEDVSKNKS